MNLDKLFAEVAQERIESKDKDSKVLIIDGLNRFLSVWAAVPALNQNGDHIGGIAGFLKSIGAIIRQENPTRCVIVFDGKGGSLRRRKLFSDYKNNRHPSQHLNRVEFSSKEDEEFSMRHQMARILNYLQVLPLTVIAIDHIEADDTIANLVTHYYGNADNKITIVSSDRDFLQLVNDRISIWSPVKKKLYRPEEIKEEFGMLPENYLLYRVLTGDASDNIPGVKGMGLKTLQKEFNLLENEYSVEEILEFAREKVKNKNSKKIFHEIILKENQIHLNYRLMQLKDSDISLSSKNQIRDLMNYPISKLNKFEVLKMMSDDYLFDSFKFPDKWLLDTFSNLDTWADGTTRNV